MKIKFSVIVVCLNAGDELKKTVDSILMQRYPAYEVIVKDGGSTDGSLDAVINDERIRTVVQEDSSIYDAMNQAVALARGEYCIFLNCGDYFVNELVLSKVAKETLKYKADIFYGDLYRRKLDSTDISPDRVTDFLLFRNVPCHQVCFYSRNLFAKRGYKEKYRVRADYEHFLWSVKSEGAKCRHMNITVCSYEGEGFSETAENKKLANEEHREITELYLGKKVYLYRFLMAITLQPVREKLAQSPLFSSIYHKLKGRLYGKK
ncbi:MAG: glycosyltransferase [Lachnospiraceae bacterium]|nr:glycosyltransferase [Lachnospiraceae bacterium]